jgi:hypothetical protein
VQDMVVVGGVGCHGFVILSLGGQEHAIVGSEFMKEGAF